MSPTPSDNGERVVRIYDEHWIRFVFPIFVYLVLIAVSVLLFLLAGYAVRHQMWFSHVAFFLALFLFLMTHHWFFLMLLSEALRGDLIITDRRVIQFRDRLFIQQGIREVAFDKVKTVEARRDNLLQNILNYGSVLVSTGSVMVFFPFHHPGAIVRDIEQTMGMR